MYAFYKNICERLLFPLQMKQNFNLILIEHSNYMAFKQNLQLTTSQA